MTEYNEANTTHKADAPQPSEPTQQKPRRRLPRWVRIPAKCIAALLVIILLIPVLLYLPPVQKVVKNLACQIVEDKTGMKIGIDQLLIKFPLDVSLRGVTVVEAKGDTMVRAREAIADVKLMPLLHLDVQINKLKLVDGYYRMQNADSSMTLKMRAGLMTLDNRSWMNVNAGIINLNKARLKDADIQVYMNVWKKTPSADTTATKMRINIRDLQGENIRYAMSMLPTIDTLVFQTQRVALADAALNLTDSQMSARMLKVAKGNLTYITPTEQYVATHPVPVDTISPPSPPMQIRGEDVVIEDFNVLYATKGAKPQPGFDPKYVQLTGLNAHLQDFYNSSSTITAPVLSLSGLERCGLTVVDGHGTFRLDSIGMALDALHVETPVSTVDITAGLPFALMELKPQAPVDLQLKSRIGLSDVEAFMPSVRAYTKYLPHRYPVQINLDTRGTLSSVKVRELLLNMPDFMRLKGDGYAQRPLDFKKMRAEVNFDGELKNPAIVHKYIGDIGMNLPPFSIKGRAGIDHENYSANFDMRTPHGDLAAKGALGMNSETYTADLTVNNVNVAKFLPDLGVGYVTANLTATGAGFDPRAKAAHSAIKFNVGSMEYQGVVLRSVVADVTLAENRYSIDAHSPNPQLDFDLAMAGDISQTRYSARGEMHLRHANLEALGFADDLSSGNGDIRIDGYFNPQDWTGRGRLTVSNFDWNLPDQYFHLPAGVDIFADAQPGKVTMTLDSDRTHLDFNGYSGLQRLMSSFSKAVDIAADQLKHKSLDVDTLHKILPRFDMALQASGRGLIRQLLSGTEVQLDTLYAQFGNDSIIRGHAGIGRLANASIQVDTLTLQLAQRGNLLDYKTHMGNRPGTLDEFARVDLNGYVGANRVSAYLRQYNLQGDTGYRFGITGAMMDSLVSVHFTPLKATIAYLPWTFNSDNHLEYNLETHQIEANLNARSKESSVYVKTLPNEKLGGNDLRINIANLKIQDFLQMSVFAPPITGSLNSDITLHYTGNELQGNGTIGLEEFYYDKTRVGNLDLSLNAGVDLEGRSNVEAALNVDGQQHAMILRMLLLSDAQESMRPEDVELELDHLPLRIANPFIGADIASLKGTLSGTLSVSGGLTNPIMNGGVRFDDASVYVPIIGSAVKFDKKEVKVNNNIVSFNNFNFYGANANPITLAGKIDATKISDIRFDLNTNGSNFQLINTNYQSSGDLYGKLFMNLGASVRGAMSHMDVRGDMTVLGTSNFTYVMPDGASALTESDMDNVVKFVNLNDTTQTVKTDSIETAMNMRVNATLNVNAGTQVEVLLDAGGRNKVQLSPSGSLTYYQNYMGDVTVNGQIYSGNGMARYNVPLLGEKTFILNPASYVLFNGNMMNPLFSVKATDNVKANVTQSGGNTRLVNFLVTLNATGSLSAPVLNFDLSTEDDMTLQNQLQSMSADQRSTQAMNLLLTGQYSSMGAKTDATPNMGTVYGLLSSQLNSLLARSIKGVDLTLGVDQYDSSQDGQNSVTTSYSYQVSKSLFNNKFKINVGGNYSTDASAEDNLTQNILSDVSMEYVLRQTTNTSIYTKLFRHQGYESILEGEVIETGVGIVMKRRISNIKNIFTFRRTKPRKQTSDSIVTEIGRPDSVRK